MLLLLLIFVGCFCFYFYFFVCLFCFVFFWGGGGGGAWGGGGGGEGRCNLTANSLQHVCLSGQGAHVQHVVCLAVRRDSLAIRFVKVKITFV